MYFRDLAKPVMDRGTCRRDGPEEKGGGWGVYIPLDVKGIPCTRYDCCAG